MLLIESLGDGSCSMADGLECQKCAAVYNFPWASQLSTHAPIYATHLPTPCQKLTSMRWPLRNQIMLPLLAVAVASLTAVGVINARLATRQTGERIEQQLKGVVGVLTRSSFPLTDAVLRQMRDLSRAEFVLADSTGRPVATSLRETPPPLPHKTTTAGSTESSLRDALDVLGKSYFHSSTRLPARTGGEQARTLHILFPRDEYRRTWRQAFIPPLVIGVVTVGAVAAVAQLLAGRISQTMARLATEVLSLARGNFDAVELPSTDDEVRDLSVAVNQTAEMLAEYEQQVRRAEQLRTVALLGAGLAHELRNSATGCLMALDLHAESCRLDRQDESLAVAKRQLRLMENQLQRLLAIGKAPSNNLPREVDLTTLIEEVLPLVRPAAHHADVALEWLRPDAGVQVWADAEALGPMIVNLILNAIEAVQQSPGEADRRVEVRLDSNATMARLTISDTGPGLQDAATESAFEPFVTTKPEGIGLGLAVARQVVEAHHGTIDWTRDATVTTFRIALPLSAKGLNRV